MINRGILPQFILTLTISIIMLKYYLSLLHNERSITPFQGYLNKKTSRRNVTLQPRESRQNRIRVVSVVVVVVVVRAVGVNIVEVVGVTRIRRTQPNIG